MCTAGSKKKKWLSSLFIFLPETAVNVAGKQSYKEFLKDISGYRVLIKFQTLDDKIQGFLKN